MRNIDIFIPFEAFRFLLNHSLLDRETKKGSPKIVIYWRKKDGKLGQSVLSYEDAFEFAKMCKFPSYWEQEDYLGFFLPSLKTGNILESSKNYRFKTYNYITEK